MAVVTMSSKGQIVIPKNIRDSLHLKDGAKFNVRIRGNEIVFSRTPDWRAIYERIQPSNVSLTEALLEERKFDRNREDDK